MLKIFIFFILKLFKGQCGVVVYQVGYNVEQSPVRTWFIARNILQNFMLLFWLPTLSPTTEPTPLG